MKRNDYYDKLHKKNLPAFKELIRRIINSRILKIIDIRIDKPDFGHQRVTIFLHSEEENG